MLRESKKPAKGWKLHEARPTVSEGIAKSLNISNPHDGLNQQDVIVRAFALTVTDLVRSLDAVKWSPDQLPAAREKRAACR